MNQSGEIFLGIRIRGERGVVSGAYRGIFAPRHESERTQRDFISISGVETVEIARREVRIHVAALASHGDRCTAVIFAVQVVRRRSCMGWLQAIRGEEGGDARGVPDVCEHMQTMATTSY